MAADLRRLALLALLALVPRGGAAQDWPSGTYPIIVWHEQTAARAAGLRRLGVTAGRVFGVRGELSADMVTARVAPMLAAGLGFYVENIATDFYAAYHRFQPDHPVTWAFDQARALRARNPTDPAADWRVPSLSDPQALASITARLDRHVRLFGPYRPLFYNLGDETGIADLAAAWDFDFGTASIAAFRSWLKSEYGTLLALNQQWDSQFAAWDDVVPQTTDQAIAGPDRNFSAWADFKAFMDTAFAGAVRAGTDAVHAADPAALAGIEGAQIPGWGGYDYAKLAGAVDVMEIYDFGDNVEIARALNPALRLLTTIAPADAAGYDADRGRLWHALLLGERGLIIWDEARALVDDRGAPTALGTAYATLFTDLSAAAARLATATPALGPVAILYSQASFRIGWLLDRRADGQDWSHRDSETEGRGGPWHRSLERAASVLTHLGLAPRYVSDETVEAGALLHDPDVRVLLLPAAIALSDKELAAIAAFVASGGHVLADTPPGLFDSHGRRRPAPPLADARILPDWWDAAPSRWADLLHHDGVTAPVSLDVAGAMATDIDVRLWQDGAATLIGLQRDAGPEETVTLTLAQPSQVCDLRRHRALGAVSRVSVPVGRAEPALLAIAALPDLACPAATP